MCPMGILREWFSETIGVHEFGGNILDGNSTIVDHLANEFLSDIYMLSSLVEDRIIGECQGPLIISSQGALDWMVAYLFQQ